MSLATEGFFVGVLEEWLKLKPVLALSHAVQHSIFMLPEVQAVVGVVPQPGPRPTLGFDA